MLETCFTRHTEGLIRLLAPEAVSLSGAATYAFAERVQRCVPEALIIKTLHYAYRKGREVETLELQKVHRILSDIRKGCV